MLVLSRGLNESIYIGHGGEPADIVITIVHVDRLKANVGIQVPLNMYAMRSELAPDRAPKSRQPKETYAEQSEEVWVGSRGDDRPTRQIPRPSGGGGAELPPPEPEDSTSLVEQLFNDDPRKQESAARGLGSIYANSPAVAALSALQATLPDKDLNPPLWRVFSRAIRAIVGNVSLAKFIKAVNDHVLINNNDSEAHPPMPPKEEHVKALFADLSEGYDSRAGELRALSHAYTEELAKQLATTLNAKVQGMPHDTYEEKKDLAKWVNDELRSFDLAIKCPKTGQPSQLHVDPGNHPESGRFQLMHKTTDGRRVRPVSTSELPVLELMEAPLRREGLTQWHEKVRRNRSQAQRG